MAILLNDVTPRVAYVAAGAQTTFVVPFEFFEETDLEVYVNGVLMTYDATPSGASEYSVTGAGDEGGGSITFGAGRTLSDAVTIIRNLPIERLVDFPTSGSFNIPTLNLQLAKIFAILQEVASDVDDRLLRLGAADVSGSGAYDALSNKIENLDDPTADQDAATKYYVDSTTPASAAAAAASATAAANSATAAATSATAADTSADAADVSEAAAAASATAAAASAAAAANKLPLAGGTMTGDILIEKVNPALLLKDTDGTVNKRKILQALYTDRIQFDSYNDADAWQRTVLCLLHDGGAKLTNWTVAQRPTGEEGLIGYNSDTDQFEGYANSAWHPMSGNLTHGAVRLDYSSATALTLSPFGGNGLMINGRLCYLDGPLAINNNGLAANTTYYLYIKDTDGDGKIESGDFEWSTTGYTFDTTGANAGVRRKNGDASRTLAGIVRANNSAQFVDTTKARLVRSWFNDRGVSATGDQSTGSTTSGTMAEVVSTGRVEVVTWDAEKYICACAGYGNMSTGNALFFRPLVDAGSVVVAMSGQQVGAGLVGNVSCSGASVASEGYHYFNLGISVSGGTGTVNEYVCSVITVGSGA